MFLEAGYVLAITQLLKNTFSIPERFKPLTAVLIGVAIAIALKGPEVTNVFEGIGAGLIAIGAYSGTKLVAAKK